jgi:hypothetical protein
MISMQQTWYKSYKNKYYISHNLNYVLLISIMF